MMTRPDLPRGRVVELGSAGPGTLEGFAGTVFDDARGRSLALTGEIVWDGRFLAMPATPWVPPDAFRIRTGDVVKARVLAPQASGFTVSEAGDNDARPIRSRNNPVSSPPRPSQTRPTRRPGGGRQDRQRLRANIASTPTFGQATRRGDS